MSRRASVVVLAGAAVIAAGVALMATGGAAVPAGPGDDVFEMKGLLSVPESYPFGPGDRTATIKLKMLSGETTHNVEYWVLYSDDRSLLTGAHIGSDFPQGKAKLDVSESNGQITATFTFPHTDNAKPDGSYVKPKVFASGKTVFYKWVKRKGKSDTESEIVQFTMPDKLTIVNFGDSYASGEGAPYASGAKWDNELSHRSGNSGQALAVKQFKHDHPGVAVAFKNVASSGAGVTEGMIQHQQKAGLFQPDIKAVQIPPQLDQVRDWLSHNHYDRVNIAMLSIGINEIGFGDLVTDYFILPGNIAEDKTAQGVVKTNIADLEKDYAALKDAFDRSFDYDTVLVSEYPDPTHREDGKLCGQTDDALKVGCWGVVESTSGEPEFAFAFEMAQAMNGKIKSIVKGFPGWEYTGAAMEKSKLHGLSNCKEPWFNTIGASMWNQGDVGGTWHPNATGHREFVKPIMLHELNRAYLKIQKQFTKERMKEIAVEEAKRKAAAKTKLAQKQALAASAHRVISPASAGAARAKMAETVQKAKDAAKNTPKSDPSQDNRMDDDNES